MSTEAETSKDNVTLSGLIEFAVWVIVLACLVVTVDFAKTEVERFFYNPPPFKPEASQLYLLNEFPLNQITLAKLEDSYGECMIKRPEVVDTGAFKCVYTVPYRHELTALIFHFNNSVVYDVVWVNGQTAHLASERQRNKKINVKG